MYDIKIAIKDFQKRAKNLNISIKRLCEEADIEESMFYKWKNGDTGAYISSLNKIHQVLLKREAKHGK
jgi:predicted transcriptional regulator